MMRCQREAEIMVRLKSSERVQKSDQNNECTSTIHDYELVGGREERTNSVKYFRKLLESKSRSLVVNSVAVAGGQFCAGRKTEIKKSYASWPLALPTA